MKTFPGMDPARVLALVAVLCLPSVLRAQTSSSQGTSDQLTPTYQEKVDVVGATPIHGLGIPRNWIPSNVQIATATDLARTSGIHLGGQLGEGLASVHANEAQNNPFQPDVQFRGFAASPLLGLPQGVAVYQDGIRLNEPFGDTVNWELLPTNAIASINLMPGSNPLFGLNALGGALSVQTKTGFSHPGHAASLFAGSFGRRWVDLQTAGHGERFSYFMTGRALAEEGWRDFSPSSVRQLFANVEWRGDSTLLNASVTGGVNRLVGNGAAPIQLLDNNREAIFTHPDETRSDMALVALRGRHAPGPDASLEALLYYRPATIRTLNGDDTSYDECERDGLDTLLCSGDGEGEPVADRLGRLVRVDDDDPLDGTINTSRTRTLGWGGALQATVTRPLAGRQNHFVAGVSFDGARSRYESDTELARLTGDRGAVGTGLFDSNAAVRLGTHVRHTGIYAVDFFTVVPRLTLTGAARFNQSVVHLRDRLGDDLTGDHRFFRLNPSTGLTYDLSGGITAFGSFGMASRVPTPSELSCADPEDPCRLPNAFVADPPLEQVVAHTWEGGARGQALGISWTASAFRTSSRDDLIFISSGALTNEGHFENIGDTLRRGIELGAAQAIAGSVRWDVSYTYLRATFESQLSLSSPNHPRAVDGEISVEPGDSIPGVPRHNLKAGLAVDIGRGGVGVGFVSMTSQFMRGDETNLLSPIDSFGIVNVSGRYDVHRHARLAVRVTNVFNTDYATFGVLGEADDVLGDDFTDSRFLSPGAPRAAWVGIELTLP